MVGCACQARSAAHRANSLKRFGLERASRASTFLSRGLLFKVEHIVERRVRKRGEGRALLACPKMLRHFCGFGTRIGERPILDDATQQGPQGHSFSLRDLS